MMKVRTAAVYCILLTMSLRLPMLNRPAETFFFCWPPVCMERGSLTLLRSASRPPMPCFRLLYLDKSGYRRSLTMLDGGSDQDKPIHIPSVFLRFLVEGQQPLSVGGVRVKKLLQGVKSELGARS